MSAQVIGRGYVLVRDGGRVSAVVSGPDAKSMQRRFGGRIVNAKGQPFRYAQARQVRVLTDPSAVL